MKKIVCPTCKGSGESLVCEYNDQYDRTHSYFQYCRTCDGEGTIEVEIEETDNSTIYRIERKEKE